MSKILLTISMCQDDEDHGLKPSRRWERSAWITTKTDLAWLLDHVEAEAHNLFAFASEGVTETFDKTHLVSHLDE